MSNEEAIKVLTEWKNQLSAESMLQIEALEVAIDSLRGAYLKGYNDAKDYVKQCIDKTVLDYDIFPLIKPHWKKLSKISTTIICMIRRYIICLMCTIV